MQKQTKPSNEAGFVSIEILGALAILMFIIIVVYSLWSTELDEMQKRAVAKHFEKVSIAAQEYAEENKTDLLNAATTTSGNLISIQMLKDEDLLPNGFNEKNPWQQTYNIYSRKNSDGKLQLIILTQSGKTHTTDEPKFGHVVVPSTAAITPISFIPVGDETTLRDAYGAGDEDLAAMNIPEGQRKAGHLGNVITIADGSTSGSGGTGGGSGGGGDSGTTTTPDGKVEYVHFERILWDKMGTICKDEKDRGKLYFTNDYRTNMNSYDPQFSGLYLCMYYQGNGLKLMPVLMGQNPYSPSTNPHPEPLSK